jgi:hypothetical protein
MPICPDDTERQNPTFSRILASESRPICSPVTYQVMVQRPSPKRHDFSRCQRTVVNIPMYNNMDFLIPTNKYDLLEEAHLQWV